MTFDKHIHLGNPHPYQGKENFPHPLPLLKQFSPV